MSASEVVDWFDRVIENLVLQHPHRREAIELIRVLRDDFRREFEGSA